MPSPSRSHQKTTLEIASYLRTYVQTAGLGEVYIAPFDVELAPDVVLEVASLSTAPYDRLSKYHEYARARVPEYWIVNPEKRTVEVLVLKGDTYHSLGIFQGRAILPSRVVPELPVRVEQFFASI